MSELIKNNKENNWKKNNKPLVTIVFGTYKRSDVLKSTIDSILGQTFKNFIFYIVDDNQSNDLTNIEKTQSIISMYDDERLIYIRNDNNIGVPFVFKKWLDLVKTKYYLIGGDGDILLPNAIERYIALFEENPNVSLVYSLEKFQRSDGDEYITDHGVKQSGIYSANFYLEDQLFGGKKKLGWGYAMYRTDFYNIKNIPVKYFHYWDHYFRCSYLLLSEKIGFINEVLAIRHVEKDLENWAKRNRFTDKIERLIQTDQFLTEYEITLLQQNYPVIKYRLINSINLIKSIPFCGNFNQFYLVWSKAFSNIIKIALYGIFYLPFSFFRKVLWVAKGLN